MGFQDPTYIGDLLNSVRIFNELEVDELCILDKSAATNGIPFELLKDVVSEALVPVAYGGGVKTLADIRTLLKLGIEKVILCSALLDLDFLKDATRTFGSSTIVASVDYRTHEGRRWVFTHSGSRNTNLEVPDFVDRMVACSVGEIILHSIDRDGTYGGYDLTLLTELHARVDNPLLIVGGCSGLADIRRALDCGASACGAGSLFVYYTAARGILINYPDAREFQQAGIAR